MLRQCENLSDDILEKMLQVDKYEINKLVDTLHNEHVLRYKWTFKCPHCNNLNTVFEDDKEENTCQFCSQGIDVCELKRGARIQYMVDRSDFEEYLKERDDTYSDSGGKKTNSYKVVPMKNPIVQNDRSCDGGPHNMEEQQKETRLFISHSSLDKEYVKAFVELLEDMGMTENTIFCSSCEGYNISWGKDIYGYLAKEFKNDRKNLMVLFMLSDNYYKSPACLNEMGATWILKKDYRSILLPGFEYKDIDGAINAQQIGIKLDDANLNMQLNEIKRQFSDIFNLAHLSDNKWDRVRESFIKKITDIRNSKNKAAE